MRRSFKSKKKKKKVIPGLLLLLVIYLCFQLVSNYFQKLSLVTTNEEFIKAVLVDPNYHLKYEKNSKNLLTILTKFITNFDLNNPLTVLETNLVFKEKELKTTNHSDNDISIVELEKISKHINDPYGTKTINPRVYIYNSHQLENYSSKNLEIYNITPNVMMASYLLKEKLNQLKIPTIAEEADLVDFMKLNSWTHKDSYKASRFYIIDALNKYQNLDLLIDLHRDDLSKEDSTVIIDGKRYAKILFVVGLENKNHQKNLELVRNINEIIVKRYPTLSRGVLTKEGKGVDGVYNQDLSSKMILLELGGAYNTIDEILNTIEIFAQVVKEIIGDS